MPRGLTGICKVQHLHGSQMCALQVKLYDSICQIFCQGWSTELVTNYTERLSFGKQLQHCSKKTPRSCNRRIQARSTNNAATSL